jgi:phosphomevalonate kinase
VKAAAPGKLVLSGAYAVLGGAPAIVTAVDRYVIADSERQAELVTPEVRAAIGDEPAPWFDASALRNTRGKLGLGSSAAILVASLAARLIARGAETGDASLQRALFAPALVAHQSAQRGGSGVDVCASVHGGTLVVRRRGAQLEIRNVSLPAELVWRVISLGAPASTSDLVGRVRAFSERAPERFEAVLRPLSDAASAAERALERADGGALLAALETQARALALLGDAAGAPIVTPELGRLAEAGAREGAVVLPAGAGGGDVALFVGHRAPSGAFEQARDALGLELLELGFGARGVHAISTA